MRAARIGFVLVGALTFSGLALGSIGCGSAGTEPQTQAGTTSPESAGTVAPVAANAHGLVKFVGDALGQVALRPEQRVAIEKLASDAEARHQANLPLRANLANAIAAQVEAGTIDKSALQPQIDALTAAWEQSRPLDHAAFQKVHDLLDATQRQAFVDAIHANMQAKHGDHAAHHGRGEKMQEWATALNLTDTQREQIKTTMQNEFLANKGELIQKFGDKDAHEKRGHMLDNFAADTYKVDDAMPQLDVKTKAADMTTHAVHFIEVVLPTLTPEQRKLAADKIRAKGASQEEEGAGGPL